jgi:hypothetical protein
MAEYRACEDATVLPRTNMGASRTKPGTVSALIAAYYGAPEFTGLRPSTTATYRNILERFPKGNTRAERRLLALSPNRSFSL